MSTILRSYLPLLFTALLFTIVPTEAPTAAPNTPTPPKQSDSKATNSSTITSDSRPTTAVSADTVLTMAQTILKDSQEKMADIKTRIDYASWIIGIMIALFGVLGIWNLRAQVNELTEQKREVATWMETSRNNLTLLLAETKASLEKSINALQEDRKVLWTRVESSLADSREDHKGLKSNIEASVQALSGKHTQVIAEHKEMKDDLANEKKTLLKTQKTLVNSFVCFNIFHTAIIYINEALREEAKGTSRTDQKLLTPLRRAQRRLLAIIHDYEEKEESIERNAYFMLAVVEKRLFGPQRALETLERNNLLAGKDVDGGIFYNAACYACLLSEDSKWPIYLEKAIRQDPDFKGAAIGDSDFARVKGEGKEPFSTLTT